MFKFQWLILMVCVSVVQGYAGMSPLIKLSRWIDTPDGGGRAGAAMRSIAAGYFHTCVLDDEGAKCWGRDDYGQTIVPTNLIGVRQIAAGGNHTCAVDDEGVKCWGSNGYGQTSVPTDFKNLVVAIR